MTHVERIILIRRVVEIAHTSRCSIIPSPVYGSAPRGPVTCGMSKLFPHLYRAPDFRLPAITRGFWSKQRDRGSAKREKRGELTDSLLTVSLRIPILVSSSSLFFVFRFQIQSRPSDHPSPSVSTPPWLLFRVSFFLYSCDSLFCVSFAFYESDFARVLVGNVILFINLARFMMGGLFGLWLWGSGSTTVGFGEIGPQVWSLLWVSCTLASRQREDWMDQVSAVVPLVDDGFEWFFGW